jgi:hypothetical protein
MLAVMAVAIAMTTVFTNENVAETDTDSGVAPIHFNREYLTTFLILDQQLCHIFLRRKNEFSRIID